VHTCNTDLPQRQYRHSGTTSQKPFNCLTMSYPRSHHWLCAILCLLLARTASASIFGYSGGSTSKATRQSDNIPFLTTTTTATPPSLQEPTNFYVTKRDNSLERLDPAKIQKSLERLSQDLDCKYVDLPSLTDSIVKGVYPNVTAHKIVILSAETAASLGTQHIDYTRLAARILVQECHKTTPDRFSQAISDLYGNGHGFVSKALADLVDRRNDEIDAHVDHSRDFELTYFGFKTLARAYLLCNDHGDLIERPQYMFMRVALGIHCVNMTSGRSEDDCLRDAIETYDLMSRGYFTHASPTLFHSGTTHPQMSSCFLVQMSEDSIQGIYETLQQCAVISKGAGGIGLSVHNIRARGTPIRGTRGVSNGLVPMLRVYDVTSRYVDQGGGRRPGAFAIYLEPWHADIFDVLNLKKNHGKEEQRARDLFYGLWIPDLFMRRVEEDGVWSLMCPHQCPGLMECHGEAFDSLYSQYEDEGHFVRQVRARELWNAILESQIETGTPYMLYKDACNAKSNQNNLGTIQSSNLCTEIVQYTSKDEVAVCNLASICLARFVVSSRGQFGSVHPEANNAYFDHDALRRVTKIVTRNLNRIIDINSYPTPEAQSSNLRHRPIGIGVSGLADAFLRLGLPFTSAEAKQLNEAIFETIYHAALEASAELAEIHGPYESYAGSLISQGKLQFELWGAGDDETPSHRHACGQQGCHQVYSECVKASGYDWQGLRERIMKTGVRNSLLLAPMPTASTSQILGVNECFEPFSSNLYIRRVKAGEFIMVNPHLLQDLTDRGLWTPTVRNQMMRDGGSVQNIPEIPDRLKHLYKTVWEIKMKDIIDMAADRGKFIDQSQSLNLFIADPTMDKLTAMHFYAWRKGLKTGMYYLRTKPAVNAIQYTVDKGSAGGLAQSIPEAPSDVCMSCSA
jgi:ribonucleoside-diphosphate reductase alpha subunit